MELKDIKRIVVLGSGAMGNGIAHVSAQAGYQVTMTDISEEFTRKGLAAIDKNLQRGVDKGRMKPEEKQAILSRIKTATGLEAAAEADFVIEAIPEDLALKQQTFKKLGEVCRPEVVLATNTSALPIASIAAACNRPDKVVGMHFMNPVPVMQLVEIIPAITTAEETTKLTEEVAKALGKTPVRAMDYAGFIVSRILDAMLNEAFRCVMDGNDPKAVDTAIKLGLNHPMGPLELADLAGVDIVFHGLETMHRELGDRFQPVPLVRQMVRAGRLGRKTGHGFYKYT